MLSYKSMAKAASKRRDRLRSQVASAKADLAKMELELQLLERILTALPSREAKRGPGRPRGSVKKAAKRGGKPGKWRPGRPGRPPKWYLEQQKEQKAATTAPAKKAKKAKAGKKKPVSPKVLAALERARAARAAKVQAGKSPESSTIQE
ncbi:MAG: hypothetical protein L6R43_00585 [Planctomycetes bacterium]|nr:hypothetical protein [Planctomycetota bacterium]